LPVETVCVGTQPKIASGVDGQERYGANDEEREEIWIHGNASKVPSVLWSRQNPFCAGSSINQVGTSRLDADQLRRRESRCWHPTVRESCEGLCRPDHGVVILLGN
jgi:hypothetical protein